MHLQLALIDSFWLSAAPRFVDLIEGRSWAVVVWLVFVEEKQRKASKAALFYLASAAACRRAAARPGGHALVLLTCIKTANTTGHSQQIARSTSEHARPVIMMWMCIARLSRRPDRLLLPVLTSRRRPGDGGDSVRERERSGE